MDTTNQIQKIKDRIDPFYTIGEEIANGITHGIGALLSVAALTSLIILASMHGDVWRLISFTIYGSSLIILYLSSTLYHSLQHPRAKRVFRIFDHAAIYLLIAGTYTPFLLVSLRQTQLGWIMLIIIWSLALIGVTFKIFFVHRFQIVSTIAYVLMGWLCVIGFQEMMIHVPSAGLFWLGIGGIVYTAGVFFFAVNKIPYNHAIWHLFVLGGSICHYIAILSLVPVTV